MILATIWKWAREDASFVQFKDVTSCLPSREPFNLQRTDAISS